MSSSKPAAGIVFVVLALPASAAEDLRALQVQGQRGQSPEQTRRDRYECHNWAIEQTGESPAAVPADEPQDDGRDRRRERIDRAIVGAAIGGALGSILGDGHHHHDSGEDVLVGAAAGAAIGAITASAGDSRRKAEEAEQPSDYLRALTACLEGRGYAVSMPTTAELAANR